MQHALGLRDHRPPLLAYYGSTHRQLDLPDPLQRGSGDNGGGTRTLETGQSASHSGRRDDPELGN